MILMAVRLKLGVLPARYEIRVAMKLFHILAILISLSAVFSYLNYRYLKLPTAIGLMLIALLASLLLLILGPLAQNLEEYAEVLLRTVDFDETLLHGMLSFLLFAGALHVNLADLVKQRWVIATLATASVLGATFIVGFSVYWVFGLLGLEIPLIYCLLFGALIAFGTLGVIVLAVNSM